MKPITAGGWATTMRKPLCWTSWYRTPNGSQSGAWEIDMEAKRAEGKGVGYERRAKVHNLKQAAKAWNI